MNSLPFVVLENSCNSISKKSFTGYHADVVGMDRNS